MKACNWPDCTERAAFHLAAEGPYLRQDDLCGEHANRERDNLFTVGCTVTLTAIPATCEYEYEVWGPHEGCAEFMDEPESFPCGKPATRVFDIVFHAPYGEDEHERLYACDEHSIEDDMFTTIKSVVPVG